MVSLFLLSEAREGIPIGFNSPCESEFALIIMSKARVLVHQVCSVTSVSLSSLL